MKIYPFRKTVYNCKQATLLSIKKEEGRITFVESLKLRYHLLYCDPCRRFIDQWKSINANHAKSTDVVSFQLSEESRRRLEREIKNHFGM